MVLHRAFDDGNAEEQLFWIFEEPGNVRCFPPPAAPPHPLEKGRNGIRRTGLNHDVKIPDVNTQFQRACADDAGAVLGGECRFRQCAGCRGERGMVDEEVLYPSGTRFCELFCAAAAVDKNECLFTGNGPDEGIDPVLLLRFDNKEELFLLRIGRDMDNFLRMPPVREPVKHVLWIPDRCGKTDTLDLPLCQLVHAVEQHLQVHTPL